MDEKKATDDESRRPPYSPIHISHLAPLRPTIESEVDVDESDEGDEDSTGDSILAEPRSGDSGLCHEDLIMNSANTLHPRVYLVFLVVRERARYYVAVARTFTAIS